MEKLVSGLPLGCHVQCQAGHAMQFVEMRDVTNKDEAVARVQDEGRVDGADYAAAAYDFR